MSAKKTTEVTKPKVRAGLICKSESLRLPLMSRGVAETQHVTKQNAAKWQPPNKHSLTFFLQLTRKLEWHFLEHSGPGSVSIELMGAVKERTAESSQYQTLKIHLNEMQLQFADLLHWRRELLFRSMESFSFASMCFRYSNK